MRGLSLSLLCLLWRLSSLPIFVWSFPLYALNSHSNEHYTLNRKKCAVTNNPDDCMSDLSPTEASTGQTDADYIAPKDATPAPCVAKQPKADNALNKTETVPGAPQYDNPLVGFPASQPEAPPFDHGWFLQTHINVFSALITEDTKVIAEIGSWYGASTKWVRLLSI